MPEHRPNRQNRQPQTVFLNQRAYAFPRRPVVAICIDGCDPAYIKNGLAENILPNIRRFLARGFGTWADAVVPTFTNPNNLSIVTGSPPAVHGISGNYFLDPTTGQAVMMTDPTHLRSETLLACFSHIGAKVIIITAKDKLCRLLGHGVADGMCFSAEKAEDCTITVHGIENVCHRIGRPQPDVYSAELSLFVLEAGLALFEQHRPDLMYLSLSDYVQHKHAPGSAEANAFYAALDRLCGRLADAGALVALTADHGMNAKPRVVFLQDILNACCGQGKTRVICPITDPYVVHHGALGSFVRVYCLGAERAAVRAVIVNIPGIEAVYDKHTACEQFLLPPDREADLIVLGDQKTAIGAAERDHDLSGLGDAPLRSHGGRAEQSIPFILSEPISEEYQKRAETVRLRNFDLFDYALNGARGLESPFSAASRLVSGKLSL